MLRMQGESTESYLVLYWMSGISRIGLTSVLKGGLLSIEISRSARCASHPRRRRCISAWRWDAGSRSSRYGCSLGHHGRSDLVESVLNRSDQIQRENRSRIHGSSNWLLPRPKHFLHALTGGRIHHRICLHEYLEDIATQIQGVWCPYILDDRVENIERWQLLCRGGLVEWLARVIMPILATILLRLEPTLRMCFSSTSAITKACSVFSRAITVKLLISNRILELRSSSAKR